MVLSHSLGHHMLRVVRPLERALIPTHDPEEYLASPIGRCFIAPTFAMWCYAPDLQGSMVWGQLDERALRDMMEMRKFIYHPDIGTRRRVVTDCHEIERADADILLGFITSARAQLQEWSVGLERIAMVVPESHGGIMLSGALPMAGLDHAMRVTHDVASALAFLEHPDAAAGYAAAAALLADVRGSSALLSRLRVHLGRTLNTATIENCASALGMSTRTLQRELRRLNTSFSDELRRVRIATAESLLVQTDLKIEAIAIQVGFGTASRMSASLRRELNLTASELRAERRVPRSVT